jgi:TRAP-type C4-dicarboxylate transport system substrate-binding protein
LHFKRGAKLKKYFLWLITIATLIAVLAIPACTTPAPAAPATPSTPAQVSAPVETKILKFAYDQPKTSSLGQSIELFAQEFTKRSEGRYKVETYPAKSLIEMAAAIDSLKTGVVEMTFISIGNFLKIFPLSSVTLSPALTFSQSTEEIIFESSEAFNKMYEKFPEIQQEWSDFKLIHYSVLSPYILISKKKEVHKPSDFSGMRVGGTGMQTQFVTLNGGAEVKQIPPDAYMNMDKGVVDASFVNWVQIHDFKLMEISDYFYEMAFSNGALAIVMNNECYNAMSPQDQKLLQETWDNEAVPLVARTRVELDNVGRTETTEAKRKIVQPTVEEKAVWVEAAEPIFAQWIKDAEALGAKNADKVLAEWKNLTK